MGASKLSAAKANRFYESIEVWYRNENDSATKFACLRRLSDGRFAVQSADSFYPTMGKDQISESFCRFIELFMEEDPSDRCDWFPSLDEAIANHLADFGLSTD